MRCPPKVWRAAGQRPREAAALLVMRTMEFGAAGLVLLFGAGLLLGYIAAERVTCF